MLESFLERKKKQSANSSPPSFFMFGIILREELRQVENGGVKHMSDIFFYHIFNLKSKLLP